MSQSGPRGKPATGIGIGRGPLVEVHSLYRRLGAVEAVAGVSFTQRRGEIAVVLGENGAGKTTLLRLMAGLLRPAAGSVRTGGRRVSQTDPISRAGLAFVGHGASSYDELSVIENVRFAAQLRAVAPDSPRIRETLEQVDLWRFRDRRARELSRGMRQRLELAGALVADPEVILLDEPFNALDSRSRASVDALLAGRKPNAAILIATHEIDHARSIADRVLVLHRGRLQLDATVESLGDRDLREVLDQAAAGDPPHQPAESESGRTAADSTPDRITRRRPGWLRAWRTLVTREFRAELRSREFVPAMVVLGVLMLMVFSLAFAIPPEDAPAAASGAFWASLIFATVLGAVRGFAVERDRGTLQTQLLAPISRSAIFGGKWIVNFVSIALVGGVAAVVTSVFFRIAFAGWMTVLTVLVAAAALASIATLYGALLTNTRAREMLAPVLMLPVTMPVLIGGVAATLDSLSATAVPARLPWLGLVLAYCAILLSLAVLLVDYIFED